MPFDAAPVSLGDGVAGGNAGQGLEGGAAGGSEGHHRRENLRGGGEGQAHQDVGQGARTRERNGRKEGRTHIFGTNIFGRGIWGGGGGGNITYDTNLAASVSLLSPKIALLYFWKGKLRFVELVDGINWYRFFFLPSLSLIVFFVQCKEKQTEKRKALKINILGLKARLPND